MTKRHVPVCIVSILALFAVACPDEPTGGDDADTGGMADTEEADTGVDTGEPTDTGTPDDTFDPPMDSGMEDSGNPDGGMDGGTDGGDTGPGVPPVDFYYFSSGGGTVGSSGFNARVSFGAPSPRGTASSSSYRLRIGPVRP